MTPHARDPIAESIESWLAAYGGPAVHLGSVLCGGDASSAALLLDDASGTRTVTYGELDDQSQRLAIGLQELGVRPGDSVAVLLPRTEELVVAMLASWRAGAVVVPLFTAFGPEAVAMRVRDSRCKVLVTDTKNRHKLVEDDLVGTCIVVGADPSGSDLDFHRMAAMSRGGDVDVARSGDDTFIRLYTSGTTGNPKGVEIPIRALATFRSYMHWSLDLRPGDVYLNVADPGWAYGLWFSVVGPLLTRHRTILRNVPFAVDDLLNALQRHEVTHLAGSPTVFRSIRAAGHESRVPQAATLQRLSAAGEPLNAELLEWSERVLGTPIHDHYGQSELGMPLGYHHHPLLAVELRPASMGTAAPGFAPVVLGTDGTPLEPGAVGELAFDTERSPLMWFRGYYQSEERTRERYPFGPRYYLTGDTVQVVDGRYAFASRADDVITSSGYRVGPFEIESELLRHPAVADVAVIGIPDPLRGEAIAAVVVLVEGAVGDDALVQSLKDQVKSHLAAHLVPRQITFVDSLPRTPSGKVRRAALRAEWPRTA